METSLVYSKGAVALTNSILVANKFGKEHKHVLDAIRNLLKGCAENSALTANQDVNNMFSLAYYDVDMNNGTGAVRQAPMYVMNRDGFTLLAMGFTGDKALRFKLEYIKAFNKMEEAIKNPQPLTQGQMLVQMAQAYEAQERMLLEQQEKQRVMETQIHRLECATDVNYGFMAVLGYAKLHGLAITRKVAATIGKAVSKYCRDNKIQYGSQKHPIFGNVNIYPDHALQAVFPKFFPNTTF